MESGFADAAGIARVVGQTGVRVTPTHLRFSPDARQLISQGLLGDSFVWDVGQGARLATVRGSSGAFIDGGRALLVLRGAGLVAVEVATLEERRFERSLGGLVAPIAVSSDGQLAVSEQADHSLILWNVTEGRQIRRIPRAAELANHFEIHPDGERLFVCRASSPVEEWDLSSDADRPARRLGNDCFSATLDSSGERLVVGGARGSIEVFDLSTGSRTLRLEAFPRRVDEVAFVPGTSTILATSWLGGLKVFDLDSGETVATHQVRGVVHSMAVSDAGALVALGFGPVPIGGSFGRDFERPPTPDPAIEVRRIATWDLVRSIEQEEGILDCDEVSASGASCLERVDEGGWRLRSTKTGRVLSRLAGEEARVKRAVFDDRGVLVLSREVGGVTGLFDGRSGELLRRLDGAEEFGGRALFSPDSKLALVGGTGPRWGIWSLETGALLHRLDEPSPRPVEGEYGGRSGPVEAVFSGDGARVLLVTGERQLAVWDVATGRRLALLKGSRGFDRRLRSSRDGRIVAAFKGGRVGVWDVETTKRISLVPDVLDFELTPDGRKLLTHNADRALEIRDVEAGDPRIIGEAPLFAFRLERGGKAVRLWGSRRFQRFDLESDALVDASSLPLPHGTKELADGRYIDFRRPELRLVDANGELLMTWLVQGEESWAVWTPDGRWDRSASAAHLLRFVRGGRLCEEVRCGRRQRVRGLFQRVWGDGD